MTSDIDKSWTRFVLRNAGVRLFPLEKDHYSICKVCGQEFKSSNLSGYTTHIRLQHPQYLTRAGRDLAAVAAHEAAIEAGVI